MSTSRWWWCAFAAAGTAGCATVSRDVVAEELSQRLRRDAGLASVLCGYAVQNLRVEYVPEGGGAAYYVTFPGGFDSTGGEMQATVRGRPTGSPGVPAGERCDGEVRFTYRIIYGAGRITSVVEVTRRATKANPAAPPAYRVAGMTRGALVIPLSVEAGGSRNIAGLFVEGWDAVDDRGPYSDYTVIVEPSEPVQIHYEAGADYSAPYWIEILTPEGRPITRINWDGSGERDVWGNPLRDAGVDVHADHGDFVLVTPGVYLFRLRGPGAGYILDLSTPVPPSPPR